MMILKDIIVIVPKIFLEQGKTRLYKIKMKPRVVVHIYNPNYSVGRGRRILV
jgi:hypothetical protein